MTVHAMRVLRDRRGCWIPGVIVAYNQPGALRLLLWWTERRTEMTKSPDAVEFKKAVRDSFGYLGRAFAFREVDLPAKQVAVNPFFVRFANFTGLRPPRERRRAWRR